MKRCTNCILPETFPDIEFDEKGVCSICQTFKGKDNFIPSMDKLRVKFEDIIKRSKSNNNHYDGLVAYSGGKDSTYLIYKLKKDYDLNLLAVTFDNGFITPHTFTNMKKVLEKMAVDHIVFKPRYDILKKIYFTSANQQLYPISLLKFGSSVCISCIRMVTSMSLRIAIEKKIPMILLGNSPGQLIQSEDEILYQDNRIPYVLKKSMFKKLADEVGDGIFHYLLLDKEVYKSKPFPFTCSPFPVIGYDEKEIYEAIKTLGWIRPGDVDSCSTNCQLNSYGIVKHCQAHNFHPYDYEMSMLVRLGTISREEALRRVDESDPFVVDLATKIDKTLKK